MCCCKKTCIKDGDGREMILHFCWVRASTYCTQPRLSVFITLVTPTARSTQFPAVILCVCRFSMKSALTRGPLCSVDLFLRLVTFPRRSLHVWREQTRRKDLEDSCAVTCRDAQHKCRDSWFVVIHRFSTGILVYSFIISTVFVRDH